MTDTAEPDTLDRLTEVLDRLEALGLSLGGPSALAAADAYGNPAPVASGELIESAWGNAVVARGIKVYPSKAVMDAAGGSTGAIALTSDNGVQYRRLAAGWSRITPMLLIHEGAGGSYPANTLLTYVDVPADPGPRILACRYNCNVANNGGTLDMRLKVAPSIVSQWRHPSTGAGAAAACVMGRDVAIAAGAAPRVNIENSIPCTVPADATFNHLTVVVYPA